MESPVVSIRYPEMRAEVVGAVGALADLDYQQKVWIRQEYPHDGFYDSLAVNVSILFDDSCVLPEPAARVEWILYPNEVAPLRELGETLDPLIIELGDVDDARYLAHPRWPEVVRAAGIVLRVLAENDVPGVLDRPGGTG